MIAINIFFLNHSIISDEQLTRFSAQISAERQKRALSLQRRNDRSACICSELLLRYALQKQQIPTSDLRIEVNRYGKPYLPDFPEVHFNLSHSHECLALACADHEIGLDIQKVLSDRNFLRIADRFFTAAERNYVQGMNVWDTTFKDPGVKDPGVYTINAGDISANEAPPAEASPAARFTKLWTMKESYVKFIGTGLWTPLNAFAVNAVTGRITPITPSPAELKEPLVPAAVYTCRPHPDYYLSLCCAPNDSTVRFMHVLPDEL